MSECSAPLCVAKVQLAFSCAATGTIGLDSVTDASEAEGEMKIITFRHCVNGNSPSKETAFPRMRNCEQKNPKQTKIF